MIKYFEIFEKLENIILYHGSNKEFNEFDDNKLSSGDSSELFGRGYYLTDNIEVAKFYAKMVTKKEKITHYTNTGIFKSAEPHFSKDADEYAELHHKINRFRVVGNILDCMNYILDDKFLDFMRNYYSQDSGFSSDKIFNNRVLFMREHRNEIRNFRGELWYLITQCGYSDKNPIINYIKSMGFDGIKYSTDIDFENETGWNYVIYNKSVISSL